MKYGFLFRSLVLIFIFSATLFTIKRLREKGLGDTAEAFLTAEEKIERIESNPEKIINWCQTRVKSIKLKNFGTVYQEGMKWYFKTSESEVKTVNFLEFEKWFVRHCKVKVSFTPEYNQQKKETFLDIEFIKGKPTYFSKSGKGYFSWMRSGSFLSPQFEKAIGELKTILLNSDTIK